MENNFRNYTVCAKVSASQKKIYAQVAAKEGLSLSEWIGTTLDISVQEKYFKKITPGKKRNLEMYLNEYEKQMKYQEGGKLNNPLTKNDVEKQEKTNSLSNKEINQCKSLAKDLNLIGALAFVAAIIFKQ